MTSPLVQNYLLTNSLATLKLEHGIKTSAKVGDTFFSVNYDQIEKVRGMDIIVTTTAKTDEEARELLRLFGFPFPAEAEAAQAA